MDFLEGTKKTRVISERAIVLKHFDLFHINRLGKQSHPSLQFTSLYLSDTQTLPVYVYACATFVLGMGRGELEHVNLLLLFYRMALY